MSLLFYNQQWQEIVQLCLNHKSSSSMLHPQAKVFGSVPERHGPFVDRSHVEQTTVRRRMFIHRIGKPA